MAASLPPPVGFMGLPTADIPLLPLNSRGPPLCLWPNALPSYLTKYLR